MAANFGSAATDVGEMATSASPRAGVTKNPVFVEALSNTLGNVGDMLKARREQQNQSAISTFAKQQLLVADSVAQGKRSSAFAQTVLRQNLIKAIDANPNMASDFLKTQSSIMGLSGGGKIAADGTKEEQRQIARKDQLVTAGLVSATASDQEFARADEAARIATAAAEKHKQRMDTIDTELKLHSLTDARRKALEEEKKDSLNTLVSESAEAEFLSLKGVFDGINSDPNLSEADRIIKIKETYTAWQAKTAAALGNTDSSMKSTLETTFNRLEADALARASGEIGDAELKRRNERTMANQKALALSNPDIASIATAQELFGQEGLAKILLNDRSKKALNTYMEFLAGGSGQTGVEAPSVFTDESATKNAMKQYLDDIASGAISGDPAKTANAASHITRLLESIEDDSGRISRDPKKAIALIDWMASPAFLKARTANPEAFSNIEGAAEVLGTHYHDEVSGMIKTEFKNAKVFVPSKTPTRSGLVSEPTNELVQAVGTDGGMTFQAINPDSREARSEAQRLNKTLKPIINNSLKAQAHLAGRSDYKAIWEEAAEEIVGVGAVAGGAGEDNLAGGDDGDDLTMADYAKDKALTEQIPLEEVDKDWTVGKGEGVEPKLIDLLSRVRKETGVNFRLNEGKRSTERQKELVASGASQTMNSRHIHGNAADIVILNEDGSANWDFKSYKPVAEAAKRIAAEMGIDNFVWGGDWKSLRDGVHFQVG